MKYKSLIMATHWKPNIKIWWFVLIFSPHFWWFKTSKITAFSNFWFQIYLFGEISPIKENAAMYQHRFSWEQCFHNHLYHGWKFHSRSLCGWEEGHPDSRYIRLCPVSGSRLLLVHCGLWLGTGSITLNLIQSRVHDEHTSTQPTHQMSFHMPNQGIHFTPSIFCIGNALKPTWMHLFK